MEDGTLQRKRSTLASHRVSSRAIPTASLEMRMRGSSLSLDSYPAMSGFHGARRFFCPEANLVTSTKGKEGYARLMDNILVSHYPTLFHPKDVATPDQESEFNTYSISCDWPVSFAPMYNAPSVPETANDQSPALSGVPGQQWLDELYQKPDTDILGEIEQFCRNSLKDVKTTIAKAETLSAFMGIFPLIASLSSLAFSNHPSFKRDPKKDGWMYMAIIDRFVLGYPDTDNKDSVMARKGLSDVLYRNIRCGLLHGGSLISIASDGTKNNERVSIRLSHIKTDKRDLNTLDNEIQTLKNDQNKQLDITIGAPMMYDAIEKIICGMFHGTDDHGEYPDILSSIRETYRESPFVVAFEN